MEQSHDEPTDTLEAEGQLILKGEVPLDSIELDPFEVDKLYSALPLLLTLAQMRVVIESERRARAKYEQKAKAKANKPPKKTTQEQAKANLLSLDDLNIDVSKL